ncbi:hypothetical protein POM88_033832 [Heracleum sosnowskyi]|uniref:Uncharacterized protein n=1 Tax=Heracleum sosnowskyi TaxID=360622 RepID=A0AAD8MA07_9APIA|nr:hypothetical protein POM88_033832 [Heracleum sosnowskyi]
MPADNHLQFNSLETFIIANCPLTGSIPNWLQSCANLQFLDLSWNLLTGHIPYFFSEMRLLFYESSLDPSESKGKTRKNLAGTGDREDSIIGLPFVIGSIIAFVIVVTIGHLSGWLFPKEKANKRIEIAWRRTR